MTTTAFLLKEHRGDSYATIAGLKLTHELTQTGTLNLTARGIFTTNAAAARVRHIVLHGEPNQFELSFETGDRLRARFQVDRLEYLGDFNGERNYEIELRSDGEVETVQ